MSSKCGLCGSFTWEINTESPTGSAYKVFFVRCTVCKVPIGVLNYNNTSAELGVLEKKLAKENRDILAAVNTVNENLRRLASRK